MLYLSKNISKLHFTWCTKRMIHTTWVTKGRRKRYGSSKPEVMTVDNIGLRHVDKFAESLLADTSSIDKDEQLDPKDAWPSDIRQQKPRNREASKHAYRPNVDPEKTSIILFPGQGTQYVGMCKNLLQYPNVKEMYALASEILDYDILKLSLEGPEEELRKSKFQQPAIFLASLAALEKLRHVNPYAIQSCVGTAGFSVGEFAALTFAEAFSFENALRLLNIRAELMHLSSEITKGGMLTVFHGHDARVGFACHVVKQMCMRHVALTDSKYVDCKVACYLNPDCKIIGGNEEALELLIEKKEEFKLKKIRRLSVSGAFHTNLMKDAAEGFAEAIKEVELEKPVIPVYSNVDGKRYQNPRHIISMLPKQIYSPVKWEQTMHIIYERKHDGFPRTYECGPKSSLKNLLKMVNRKAWESSYSTDEF